MDPNEINDGDLAGKSEANFDREKPFCRFCWCHEITFANPLLSSCNCNGGIKFIHFMCLKEWLNTKRQVKEQQTMATLCYKSFECELCKTPYPLFFKANNRKFCLIDSHKMQGGNYIMLDSLTLE